MSQAHLLATTGKSRAVFRASRASSEGRFAIVTKRWARDAMDVMAQRRMRTLRTAKPRGSDISTLISS